MLYSKEVSVSWNRLYGWRAGTRYIEPGASAVDVIRYEREELGNNLDVPDFLLEELAQKQVRARDVVWVCRTREHAQRYGGRGVGQPYKEDIGPNALILTTDHEPETGYLVLSDATLLDPSVVQRFAGYRQREKMLAAMVPQVEDFLREAESHRIYRQWVYADTMRVYLRKSQRLLEGERRQCLDIATIEVAEGHARLGLFTAFTLKAHELHSWDATYLEHANSIIQRWCVKRGWTNDPGTFPPSFYLLKNALCQRRG